MNIINIEKGVNLHLIKTEKFNTTAAAILVRRSIKRDEATFNAILPYVLKRGCMKYDSLRKINIRLEEMYGATFESCVIKKGEEQILQFFCETVNCENIFFETLEFLNEILFNPVIINNGFKKEWVDGEKENLKNEIDSRLNNKKEYAKQRLIEEMCKDEPFGIYGDGYKEDLDKINEKNLYEYYIKILNESPIEIMIVGDINENDTVKYIKEIFKFKRENIIDIPLADYNFNVKNKNNIQENADVSQGKLCIGMRTGVKPVGKSYYALLAANEIFGGSANSKLFVNVREKNSLCYYINSFVYRFKSIICIQSGISPNDYDKVIDMINKELDGIKKGNFNDSEFKSAISGLIKNYSGIGDYTTGIMDFYLAQYMLNDDNNLNDILDLINNIDKNDIIESVSNICIDTIYFLRSSENAYKR